MWSRRYAAAAPLDVAITEMIDAQTGRTRVRMVNVESTRYAIARRYMIRLRRDDFEDPHQLAKLASCVGLSLDEFRREFEGLVAAAPPRLQIDEKGEADLHEHGGRTAETSSSQR